MEAPREEHGAELTALARRDYALVRIPLARRAPDDARMTLRTLTSLAGLVRELRALDPAAATRERVSELVARAPVDPAELAPHVAIDDERYTRNLVDRSPLFDVIVLCWRAGHATPVHNHSGQRGWVRVLSGALEETAYVPAGARSSAGASPCELVQRVRLAESGRAVAEAGALVTVDTERAIHRLRNHGPADALSLHVYSLPHDDCLVYDLETGAVRRVELTFDRR